MKKIITTITLISVSTISFAQNSDWSKSDRNNIFEECMNVVSKYKNISKDQQESLSLCYLEEITKQYSKREYQAKIEVEISRIQQATIALCSKNIGVNITGSVNQEKIKSKINEGNFNRKDLVGEWRDENSKIFINENATFLIKWDNGGSQAGKWWINDVKNLVLDGYSIIKIVGINESEFQYEQIAVTSTNMWGKPKTTKTFIYTATRVE